MATEKQVKSRKRNWAIHQLRGIYANSRSLQFTEPDTCNHMQGIQALIEEALEALGAETHAEQLARFEREFSRM